MKKTIFIVRYRWWIIIFTLVVVLGSIIPLSQIKINPDLESYMPDSMLSKQHNKEISEVFGNEEPILIIFESKDVLHPETLKRVQEMSLAFSRLKEFEQVYSLFQTKNIRSEAGMMVVDPVVENIPETPSEIESLRATIQSNDLAYRLVVSDDFRYTLLILTSNRTIRDADLMKLVKKTIASVPGNEKVYITGQPYLRDEANNKIGRDVMILLPIGLLVMLVFLWISFREIKAVLLPFSVVIFSVIFSMALIPVFGWELSLIGVLIPIMMLAIANNYGVHFVAKYQELNAVHPRKSMNRIIQEALAYLKKPVILCGLTTIVGTLGLVVHLLLPASQMGVVSAIGIGFALLLSLMFIPAVMSLMEKGKPHKNLGENPRGFFHRLLSNTGNLVTKHPKLCIIFFVSLFIVSALGLFRMKVAPDSNKILPAKHDFNRAIAITNEHFGGNKIINIMFTGDAKNPELLKRLHSYETELEKMPNVGSVTSLATMIRKMSTALNDSSDAGFNRIPESRDAIAQYLELYTLSADPSDFERFVNFDYTKTLLTIQYQAESLVRIDSVLLKINMLLKTEPAKYVVGGLSLVDKQISESVETGQYYSLLFAFLAILVLLWIIFKSFTAGWMGSLPLLFAVFCTFGWMGWLGIELNIVTALLSSISIGLGVDFTIHIFWRLKAELASEENWIAAVKNTLVGIGRGISINAFSVMLGFSVLFLSAFPLIQSFAFLIIISLFLCLVSALIFIPALCLVLKPKFLHFSPTLSSSSVLFIEKEDVKRKIVS
ncbi:MAG: MMPL family transporter [Bacteroidales bacterium]|nr:MMPL family transporter [Bacteroidales bacterium]